MTPPRAGATPAPRSLASLLGLSAAALVVVVVLAALGTWQVHRLAWKRDLIARVDARIHAAPVAAPGPAAWPGLTPAADEYLRVRVTGRFLADKNTFVQALTEQGSGYWVLTPLVTPAGFIVLVNRGFVPSDKRDEAIRAAGEQAGDTTVTGLLRMTEPGGGFLRNNDPADDRWYSRDVAAIARARGLADVAPYFIDEDATPKPGGYPVGGLTVIRFPNNHLVYALTWYGLAVMLAGAMVGIGRDEWRRRHPGPTGSG